MVAAVFQTKAQHAIVRLTAWLWKKKINNSPLSHINKVKINIYLTEKEGTELMMKFSHALQADSSFHPLDQIL